METLEKQLSQLFDNNFDCYTDIEYEITSTADMAMTKDRFIDVVTKFIEVWCVVPTAG